jgi:small GTP-binding protein
MSKAKKDKNKDKNKDSNKDEIEFKLITLGDSGVGKTSIIKRFISGKFDMKTISTIGFGNFSKEITLKNGTKIKLSLIDTAGQENYQALSTTYIKNADGVLFVFAHNNKESFNNIKKWLDNFKENNKEIDFNNVLPAYLVGNKCDLEHEMDDDEIQDVKKENKFYGYIDTSAKDDIGINRVFDEIGEMLIKIYGKRKKGHNVKLAAKAKKHEGGCGLCQPDV